MNYGAVFKRPSQLPDARPWLPSDGLICKLKRTSKECIAICSNRRYTNLHPRFVPRGGD